ncbi:MAG: transporter, ATP-binding protein [Lachnospiraceae bacterium]|jgi:fluoroquinolone transport system ATP-binding protein|nr:transporter, ATP-binding protein [Lachnospiraceae bacterium]
MIKVENVSFSYTKAPFISNISFQVEPGEIFGFLGPSGAGKSTLQKILIGMLTSYNGSVKVNGMEVKNHDNSFYETIGVDFEFPSLYEKLTARQNLNFFSSLYSGEKRNIEELLSKVGLLSDAEKRVSDFSKGMKSRLNFIKSIVHNPSILFLDEPTSGLDPTNSSLLKEMILAEKASGKTIILTTHNMEDAAKLCDRVVFIVDGSMKAMDTPHNLIMRKGAGLLKYSYQKDGIEYVSECPLNATHKDETLLSLIHSNQLLTIHSQEQTLGDVFMEITGRKLS